jgi:hypothetical protein
MLHRYNDVYGVLYVWFIAIVFLCIALMTTCWLEQVCCVTSSVSNGFGLVWMCWDTYKYNTVYAIYRIKWHYIFDNSHKNSISHPFYSAQTTLLYNTWLLERVAEYSWMSLNVGRFHHKSSLFPSHSPNLEDISKNNTQVIVTRVTEWNIANWGNSNATCRRLRNSTFGQRIMPVFSQLRCQLVS